MSRLCFFLDKVKIGTKFTRKEGYLCTKCSCLDYRRIHDSVEDEEIMVGDVPDNFRLFLRCLIKSSDLDSDTMDAHEEKVRLHEKHLDDEEQRDQMIVRGYNLSVTGAGHDVGCNKLEEEWDDDLEYLSVSEDEEDENCGEDVEEESCEDEEDESCEDEDEEDKSWDDDEQDQILLEAANEK